MPTPFAFFNRNTVRPPATLIDLTEDEYAEVLREAKYSERLIEKELEDFRTLKDHFTPVVRKDQIPISDEENPMVQALLRRKARPKKVREVDDAEEF